MSKDIIKRYLLLVTLILPMRFLCAEESFVQGCLKYTIPDHDKEIVFVEFNRPHTLNRVRSAANRTLRIPGTVDFNGKTFKVAAIYPYGFSGYNEMDSLVIEEGVESIDENAFSDCTNLKTVHLPSSIKRIYGNPFKKCPKIERIEVAPNNLIYNSDNECNAIIHITNQELITGCKNTLIPSTVKTIGNQSFAGCNGLESIDIPDGVENINANAFEGCFRLRNIQLPESLLHIGSNIFKGCESLRSLFIPKNIRNIEFGSLADCGHLSEIIVDKNNPLFDSRNNCNAIIKTEKNELIAGCSTTIIPNSVVAIASNAFSGVSGLSHITIPANVTKISRGAFKGCLALNSIQVDKNNKIYDSRNGCNAIIESATHTLVCGCGGTLIPDNIKVIGSQAFNGMATPKNVNIPKSVTRIEWFAFEYCPMMQQLIIPGTIQYIGKSAFQCCRNLEKVIIEDGELENIVYETFYGCGNLESVAFPENLKTIMDGAFAHCYNLKNIVLPSAQTVVEPRAFEGCFFSGQKIE